MFFYPLLPGGAAAPIKQNGALPTPRRGRGGRTLLQQDIRPPQPRRFLEVARQSLDRRGIPSLKEGIKEALSLLFHRRYAVAVERISKVFCDGYGVPPFDLVPFQHVDKFAVLQDPHRWRRRKVTFEIASRPLGGLDIGAGENGDYPVGFGGMLQRHSYRRPS